MRKIAPRTVAAAALLVALVSPWMIKNKILFNEASFTTWLGFNVRNLNFGTNPIWEFVVKQAYSEEEVRAYYSDRQWERLRDEPVVTLLYKKSLDEQSTDAMVNMNHYAVPALNRVSLHKAIRDYRSRPSEYATNVAFNLFFLSLPASYVIYSYDMKTMHYEVWPGTAYGDTHDQIYYGRWLIGPTMIRLPWGKVGLNHYLFLWLPLALVMGARRLRRIREPDGAVWALLLAMYVWLVAVVVLVDGSEGARMRWQLEPVFLLLVVQGVREIVAGWRRRRSGRALTGPGETRLN
jgi:hypothetical protein